jgi:hypothetical protein
VRAARLHVTLQDREMQFVQPAMDRAAKLFEKKVKDPEKRAAHRARWCRRRGRRRRRAPT